jgi:RND family efflux transporter MFP subunit
MLAVSGFVALACCDKPTPPPPEVRPVRTVTVEPRTIGEPLTLTGQIKAQNEANLAFRIDGRLIERRVEVGARVNAGQVVARLDAQNQQNALRSAEANLLAAQGQLKQARGAFDRQNQLLEKGFTTRAQFEQAQQALQTAQAQVTSAEAQLRTAHDQVGYTELTTDTAGAVTATGAESGEVVRAGQMIVQIAPQGRRDAVFDVPAQMIRASNKDPLVEIALTDDPAVKTTGRVREVAPQADPTTRTFQVKVELQSAPEAMRLGATVTGRIVLAAIATIEIPASALTRAEGKPAVWLVDRAAGTVSLHAIEVLRYEPASVLVAQGLEAGAIVVTAGVQALRPGQKVRLLEGAP